MFNKEAYSPYDRVTLSKSFSGDISRIILRSDDFYSKYGI